MDRSKVILVVLVAVAGLFGGGVIGATAASSPSPTPTAQQTPHSNETASHEAGESAAQEQAENNGTFHPAGAGFNGGHPCGGHSNEDATHEKSESSSVEATENAACPAAPASPAATR